MSYLGWKCMKLTNWREIQWNRPNILPWNFQTTMVTSLTITLSVKKTIQLSGPVQRTCAKHLLKMKHLSCAQKQVMNQVLRRHQMFSRRSDHSAIQLQDPMGNASVNYLAAVWLKAGLNYKSRIDPQNSIICLLELRGWTSPNHIASSGWFTPGQPMRNPYRLLTPSEFYDPPG